MLTKRVKKPRIQRVVLGKMKELWCERVLPQHPANDSDFWVAPGVCYCAEGFLEGYAALRSLINTIPINSLTREAFRKWAVKSEDHGKQESLHMW